ncbi:MAG: response regulator transcription factor [Bacteroidetes bacterium]|nr:response regulator transcription factor [Bacteroidota bacterium]MBU1719739.1 response regulator transcription factor [Bacteroidota bacterium]
MKILVVEDEYYLSSSICNFLTKENYVCDLAVSYAEAEERAALYLYDCVLLDVTLPGGSGLNLINRIKDHKPTTGVIIISAKNSIDDKIKGLDLGADDYLTKPFHLAELNSRIKSVFRRLNLEGKLEIKTGNLVINPDHFEVKVAGNILNTTKKEFQLLLFLIQNKDRVLTRESIAEHLWGEEADLTDSFDFIYSHIKNLRKKIIENGGADCIHSVYGIGYKYSEA